MKNLAISRPIPLVDPVTMQVRWLTGGRGMGFWRWLAMILWKSNSWMTYIQPLNHSIQPKAPFFFFFSFSISFFFDSSFILTHLLLFLTSIFRSALQILSQIFLSILYSSALARGDSRFGFHSVRFSLGWVSSISTNATINIFSMSRFASAHSEQKMENYCWRETEIARD